MIYQNSTNQNTVSNSIVTQSVTPFATAVGAGVLQANTGIENTGIGYLALSKNTTGTQNTAVGDNALAANTTGAQNTAVGGYALFVNTTGIYNTTVGAYSLYNNVGGNQNTALGAFSANTNTTGSDNTAIGVNALTSNDVGIRNTAIGSSALYTNVSHYNTAIGYSALKSVVTGFNNTAIGSNTGSSYFIGESNNILIGSGVIGATGENNTIRIGAAASATYISGIYGKTPPADSSQPMIVSSTGQLGTIPLLAGQLIVGFGTTGDPIASTLTPGTGISITNAPGAVTIASSSSVTWQTINASVPTAVPGTGYIAVSGSDTVTLPSTAVTGNLISIALDGATSLTLGQPAGVQVRYGDFTTTLGAGGSLAASNRGDVLNLVCSSSPTTWLVISAIGNWGIT